MKRADVAAELRKAQAGTVEDQRFAVARIKFARQRVNQTTQGLTTAGSRKWVNGEWRGGPAMTIGQLAASIAASQGGRR